MSKTMLLWVTFILSFCSIGYEILFVKALIDLTDDRVVWASISIGVYMGAMGVGAWYYSKREVRGLRALLKIEPWLAILGALSVVMVYALHVVYRMNTISMEDAFLRMVDRDSLWLHQLTEQPIRLFGAATQVVLFGIGFLTGMELPALMDESKSSAKVLGVSYFSSLVASVLFAYFLIPHLSLTYISVILASLNYIAFLVVRRASSGSKSMKQVMVIPILLLLMTILSPWIESTQRRLFYHLNADQSITKIIREAAAISHSTTKYQDIDVVQNQREDDEFTMYLNGHYQFSTSDEMAYHQIMAHFPMGMQRSVPENVLILGGGDALLLREVLRYEKVKYVLNIELDEEMTDYVLGSEKMMSLTKDALLDDRVVLKHDDAFSFLRTDLRKWDAIYCDFPFPYNYDISKLYSIEFYKLAQRRLIDGGFLALDGPHTFDNRKLKMRSQDDYTTIIGSTLFASGFKSVFQYGYGLQFYFATMEEMSEEQVFDDPIKPMMFLDYLSTRISSMIQDEIKIPYFDESKVNSVFQPTLYRFVDPQF